MQTGRLHIDDEEIVVNALRVTAGVVSDLVERGPKDKFGAIRTVESRPATGLAAEAVQKEAEGHNTAEEVREGEKHKTQKEKKSKKENKEHKEKASSSHRPVKEEIVEENRKRLRIVT